MKDRKEEINASAKDVIRLFWGVSKENKRLLIVALTNPINAIAIGVGLPFFAGQTFASIVSQDGSFTRNILWLSVMVFIGTVVNRTAFLKLMELNALSIQKLRERSHAALLRRSMSFHNNNVGGKLVSDGIDIGDSYSNLVVLSLTSASSIVLTILVGLGVVFSQSLQLGLYLLVMVCVTLVWAYYDSKRRSEGRNERYLAKREAVSHFSDSIVNAPTIMTFAAEEREENRQKKLHDELTKLQLRDWLWSGRSGNNRIAFLLVSVVLLLILLNHLLQQDPTVLGTGIFAFTYTFTIILRLFDINALTRTLEDAFLKAKPMTKLLNEEPEIQDVANAPELNVSKGRVEFNNVSFTYQEEDNNQEVFSKLTIAVKPGEKIGLVGPSGGGKTTLTRLMLRFDDVQSGSILIDNQDISQVTQRSLRESIGYVPQEPLLFHRSIGENISYGKYNASEEEIVAAAKKANAHEFIQTLPNGYQTVVGERGVKLSGGQRQRVAIARAILKNAPILILDEATSALDSESEIAVQEALDALMKGKTSVVVAHRLSTIQKMDRIVVLDKGKIIEEGSHKELLKKKGQYAKLWSHQSGGFLQD